MEPQQAMQLQKSLKADLESLIPSLRSVVPKHVTPERLCKVVLSATARTPDLLLCTRTSIVRALMQAGELGLEIGGLLGEAYLVPYNNKITEHGKPDRWEKHAQCLIGYRGLMKLARQSGLIQSISARVVYAGETFHVDLANETVSHMLQLDVDRSDENIVAAYAIARLKDGGTQIDVMSRRELDAIKARSKSGNSGPWVSDKSEMCRKTVVRRLYKYLPVSTELQNALELDAETDPIIANVMTDVVTAAGTTRMNGGGLPPMMDVGGSGSENVEAATNAPEPEKPAGSKRARGVTERVKAKSEGAGTGEQPPTAAAASPVQAPPQQPPPQTQGVERPKVEQQTMPGATEPAPARTQAAPPPGAGDAWEPDDDDRNGDGDEMHR
jgi:recombination protein RecT